MFITNEIPHLSPLDQSISIQRVVEMYSHFFFIQLKIKHFEQKRPKKTPPHSVAPHLGLQCSHMFHKKDAGLYGVELTDIFLHKEVFKQ